MKEYTLSIIKEGPAIVSQGREGTSALEISVVIPCFNEAQNVQPLYDALIAVMDPLKRPWEVIFVDDGSSDDTHVRLRALAQKDTRVTVMRLRRNFGQTAALQAGFDIAAADIVVSLDADLQHDPKDIPPLIAKLEEGYDIVSGWRKDRVDDLFTRKLPSRIANRMMAMLSGVQIHDFGTTLKAYRRDVVKDLDLAPGYHRFIPALASAMGVRVTEIPIKNVLREGGKSNYGLRRILPVFFDLIVIKFLLSYLSRPMHLFGLLGFISFSFGFVLAAVLVVGYYLGYLIIAHHPGNLLLSVFLMLLGLQFFGIGLLAELNARIYRRVANRGLYTVRSVERNPRS